MVRSMELSSSQGSDEATRYPWTDAMKNLNSNDLSDDANLVRAAFWYHQVFLTDGQSRAAKEFADAFTSATPESLIKSLKSHTLSTRGAYTFNFPAALGHLRGDSPASVNRSIMVTAKILQASGCFLNLDSKGSETIHHHTEGSVSSREEIFPDDVEARLELDSPPPSLDKMGQSSSLNEPARRAIAIILLYGWQRFRSIRLVELRHIAASPNFLEVIIPDSKGGWRMMRLPVDRLAPPEEVDFLRDFLAVSSRHFTPETRLTALAGFGNIGPKGHGARSAYRAALRHFGPMHDARRCGISWAPVRAMVARDPELRRHPFFPERLREHYWFSDDGLARFRQLLPAAQTDSVEVVRRIAGWTSYSQFFQCYCRSWHIQLGLSIPC